MRKWATGLELSIGKFYVYSYVYCIYIYFFKEMYSIYPFIFRYIYIHWVTHAVSGRAIVLFKIWTHRPPRIFCLKSTSTVNCWLNISIQAWGRGVKYPLSLHESSTTKKQTFPPRSDFNWILPPSWPLPLTPKIRKIPTVLSDSIS